jgi:hypothetical protein
VNYVIFDGGSLMPSFGKHRGNGSWTDGCQLGNYPLGRGCRASRILTARRQAALVGLSMLGEANAPPAYRRTKFRPVT